MESKEEEQSQAWLQQPGEPDRWFDRFNFYRLRGAQRTLLGTYVADLERTGAKRSNKKSGLPASWFKASKKWQWQERAKAWDEYRRKRDEELWEKRREELRKKEWESFEQLLTKAKQMLEFPLAITKREQVTGEDGKVTMITEVIPARWGMGDAAKLMKTASELARLASGMETSRENITVNGKPRSADEMTDDELAAIAAGSNQGTSGTGTTETAASA